MSKRDAMTDSGIVLLFASALDFVAKILVLSDVDILSILPSVVTCRLILFVLYIVCKKAAHHLIQL